MNKWGYSDEDMKKEETDPSVESPAEEEEEITEIRMEDLVDIDKCSKSDLVSIANNKFHELTFKIKELRVSKEELMENFTMSTHVLLERLKELESVSIGQRPQTANILKKLGGEGGSGQQQFFNKNHNYYVGGGEEGEGGETIKEVRRLKTKKLGSGEEAKEVGKGKGASQETKCQNCNKYINSNLISSHTITCYRYSISIYIFILYIQTDKINQLSSV